MFSTHVPENHRPAKHDNAKTSVVNILIYNKLFLKCHVGLYTWDVPLYLQQIFLSEKDATNPLIYCISVQSHQKQLCLYKITKCLVTVCLTLEKVNHHLK